MVEHQFDEKDWFGVNIGRTDDETLNEFEARWKNARKWCYANLYNNCYCGPYIVDSNFDYEFKDELDAAKFKLMFG